MQPARTSPTPSSRKRATIWVAVAACTLFCVPLIAMQFTQEVNWTAGDFVVWGILLTAAAAAFAWMIRRVPPGKWWGAGALIAAVFVYVWAELAVGVFTTLGS